MTERRYGRISVEGWIEDSDNAVCPGLRVVTRNPAGTTWVATLHKRSAGTVEYLPQPEQWQEGDVVIGPHGGVYRRTNAAWMSWGSSDLISDEYPARPLVLLVRDRRRVLGD